jgi:Zn finger protein HypA/HybF involved in hydrogenase expression
MSADDYTMEITQEDWDYRDRICGNGYTYYSPSYEFFHKGWYRLESENKKQRDFMDKFWDSECDEILSSKLRKYGPFFVVFTRNILNEIAERKNMNFDKVYDEIKDSDGEEYFRNRILEIPELKRYWENKHIELKDQEYICKICSKGEKALELNPGIIQKQFPLMLCKECFRIFKLYFNNVGKEKMLNDDEINEIRLLYQKISSITTCDVCKRKKIFKLRKDDVVDDLFRHLNIYASVCPRCQNKMSKIDESDSEENQLKKLYDLYVFTNKIPTIAFTSLIYLYKSKNDLVSLVKLLEGMWPAEIFRSKFGSYFAALVKSGILPEGTRQTVFGTHVLAKDGHRCFSLIEKDIDDFLYVNNIIHSKEVYYPDSNYRADWEIQANGKKYFVEYFGLVSREAYEKKLNVKLTIAKNNNIELIAIFPETDWENLILDKIKI